MSFDPFILLLIEDDAQEAELFTYALGDVPDINLVHASDELAAMTWLEQHKTRLPPMVILLDLNLDGQDGHLLLERLKQDPVFRLLPVVILTSSQRPDDIERAYRMYANGYMVKPVQVEEYKELILVLTGYWRRAVRLPK